MIKLAMINVCKFLGVCRFQRNITGNNYSNKCVAIDWQINRYGCYGRNLAINE